MFLIAQLARKAYINVASDSCEMSGWCLLRLAEKHGEVWRGGGGILSFFSLKIQ